MDTEPLRELIRPLASMIADSRVEEIVCRIECNKEAEAWHRGNADALDKAMAHAAYWYFMHMEAAQ
jgi:hypothetical protein